MAQLIVTSGSRPADEGEALVVNHLREALPGTYTLIPNVEIAEPGRPPFEYDLIVVAPHAVFVVEVKRWRGGIRGDDYVWQVAGRHSRENPWPTANNKARVLKSQIQRRQPACDPLWVEAVVAIADDQGAIELQGNCRARTYRYTDLPAFLMNVAALDGKAGDLRPVRAFVERAIREAARGRQAKSLRFGDYEVLETLARRDRVAEYLARNTLLRAEERVRLRVFSYDPYLPEDEQSRRQETIFREANALQAIGRHANLIELRGFFADPLDPNLYVEVTEWSEAGTLRTLLASGAPLTLERKLTLARGMAAGLQAAHQAGVVHRDLRPENVLIGADGQPRLMSFDHARLSLSSAGTVSPIARDPDVPRAYQAPELLNPTVKATPAADLYSLGVVLFEMLVGQALFGSPEEAIAAGTTAGGPVSYGAVDVPVRLDELVRLLTKPRVEDRPQTAAEVLRELQAILEQPSGAAATPTPPRQQPQPAPAEPAVFAIGDPIDVKYQVQAVLPAGGSGRVYKVYDSVFDRVYALKVLNDTAISLDWLTAEARPLLELNHPNIVHVVTWGKLPSGRLYLVSEYVQGEDLTAYTSGAKRLSVAQAADCVAQLLSALVAMHPDVDRIAQLKEKSAEGDITAEEYDEWRDLEQGGWLHRDIKPANLMLAGDALKVIDFNIATSAAKADRTFTGTPGYMPPDVGMVRWDTSCDLFAVGIVLYELVTGHHPYPERTPNADDPPADPRQFVPNLSPQLAGLMLKAVSVQRDVRYYSARRLRNDLLTCQPLLLEPLTGREPIKVTLEPGEAFKPNYNPYVTRLLTMYSQARRSNSGTRGLDEIARLTYVETRLDRMLRPAVLDGQYRLVIITGNAGDGKTAFIKTLEEAVRSAGAVVSQTTPNSSTFYFRGRRFVTNYDGSQDEGAERANDQVLTEFFGPFADGAPLDRESVHLIAINEGRLVDFFDGPQDQARFASLGAEIVSHIQEERLLPPWLLIVDLNRRSVVARDEIAEGQSIFERQLRAMLQPELWAPCAACRWRDRCCIKFNADTLSDPVSGAAVRERLRTLFEIVHLRRQLHITMRDLRSALSWVLLQDHSCDDIATLMSSGAHARALLPLYYYSALAADSGPHEGRADDRLVSLLRQVDPAEAANPTTDRQLYFGHKTDPSSMPFEGRAQIDAEQLAAVRRDLHDGWLAVQSEAAVRQRWAYHGAMRRKTFFERRDDGWLAMLAYRHLDLFRRVTQTPEAEKQTDVKEALIQGISMAEGALNQDLARRYICVRAGQETKQKIKSFRLFPASDFDVEVPGLAASLSGYLEYSTDHLVLFHDPQDRANQVRGARRAELHVSLDVFELLQQIRAGFLPSPNDLRGHFVNLVIFRNALSHLPYRSALLTRDDRSFYELTMEDIGAVALRRVDDAVATPTADASGG